MYISDGDYIKDIEVNDLRNRYNTDKKRHSENGKQKRGAATANGFPSLELPISVVPYTISAMGSASLRFIPLASLPPAREVVSHCKSCSLWESVEEGI